MSRTTLVLPQHVARTALVYVRQSTTKQVLQNQESLRRQYQLVDAAVRLSWPQARTCVIDEDLGLSGTSSTTRQGFQRLVAAISLGEVGIVLVSRLSRLDSDWHRVIELCAVFGTLIADEDGLYDPSDPNDRLVLGLKGTLSQPGRSPCRWVVPTRRDLAAASRQSQCVPQGGCPARPGRQAHHAPCSIDSLSHSGPDLLHGPVANGRRRVASFTPGGMKSAPETREIMRRLRRYDSESGPVPTAYATTQYQTAGGWARELLYFRPARRRHRLHGELVA
jgi:hypothetical protein